MCGPIWLVLGVTPSRVSTLGILLARHPGGLDNIAADIIVLVKGILASHCLTLLC